MVVLGIDPGYAIVGWGVVEYVGNKFRTIDYGAILTDAKMHFEHRLENIYDELMDIIARFKPDAISVEELFFNSNQKTAIGVACARGVILLAGVKSHVPLYEYTPLQVKQSVVGYGRAEKRQVMEMTRILLHLEKVPKPDDTADALAIAICHAHTNSSTLMQKNAYGMVKY